MRDSENYDFKLSLTQYSSTDRANIRRIAKELGLGRKKMDPVMDEYYKDLPPDLAASIVDELSSQTRQTFDKVVETGWRLTQHNFLVNAGGAAAVLAYFGSDLIRHQLAIWPSVCFVVGVAASGIEIRTLLLIFSSLHKDALRRRAGFVENKIPAKDLGPPTNVGGCATPINHWCGWLAQIAFVAGVVVGITLFVVNTP